MTKSEIKQLVTAQRQYFYTGATQSLSFRLQALDALRDAILSCEEDIYAALHCDLKKSRFESYMCEIGLILSEITYMKKHIRRLAKPQAVRTPLAQFPSRSFRKPSPYGVTLIMSPWNYPFLLTFGPLVDAIAAGNTAIVKPSAYSPASSRLICRILDGCFDASYVTAITGGRTENTCLLQEHFDYIFFTGSQRVGKEVLSYAASHLTPVTLELGGKSPCIVEKSADLKLAAKRIVFGKFLNCGQTCVAPDYLYCDETIKDALLAEIKRQIQKQFGSQPLANPDYGKIINARHFDRILRLADPAKVVCGGASNRQSLQISPTVLDHVAFSDAVMQEEIFGPLLPVLTYRSMNEAIARIRAMPHPLALYLFTRDKDVSAKVTSLCGFGGGCINDTVIHLATSEMGFGGFGESGMGAYHGKEGFRTFSHYKSIVDKKLWLDLPMRYQPYRSVNERLLRIFLR